LAISIETFGTICKVGVNSRYSRAQMQYSFFIKKKKTEAELSTPPTHPWTRLDPKQRKNKGLYCHSDFFLGFQIFFPPPT